MLKYIFFFVFIILAVASEAKIRLGPLPELLRNQFDTVDEKIVGGEEAEPYSIPWQVSWQWDFRNGNAFHFCGGSVYNKETVITAAHCCEGTNRTSTFIVAAEHNIIEEKGFEQVRHVDKIIVHPDYNPIAVTSDICILKLSRPLEFNDKVKNVQLPDPGAEPSGDLMISGWGTISSGGPSPFNLRVVSAPYVNDATCARNPYGGYGTALDEDSHICAGDVAHGGIDACQGDSGGPMFQDGTLWGIVSWGRGCAMPGYPGVYTQVSSYLDFIENNS